MSEAGRAKIAPLVVKFLQSNNADDSEDFRKLIFAAAASFKDDETQKSAYFQAIVRAQPNDVSLAALLVNENLIGETESKIFYQTLINRSEDLSGEDYAFTSAARRVWTTDDAETVYEQENEYKIAEPENEKYEWQKKYLELLVKRRDDVEAERLIAAVEKELTNRYARPARLRTAKIRLQIRGGKYDAAAVEKFVGDAAAEIKPPSIERFNDVMQILSEEKRGDAAIDLSEKFYVRMLALGRYDAANFNGLARNYFRRNEPEKALEILRLMIVASIENKRETALAAVAALDAVRARAADAAKVAAAENNLNGSFDTLKIAAEIASEFQQTKAAIGFRRQLLEADPSDAANKIELAAIYAGAGETVAAENLLTQISNDANSPRAARWQARQLLKAEMPNAEYDAFSQFYNGAVAGKANENEAATEFFINSLIADQNAELPAR